MVFPLLKRERKKEREMDGEDRERDEVKEGGKTKKERKKCMFINIQVHTCIHIRLCDSSCYYE